MIAVTANYCMALDPMPGCRRKDDLVAYTAIINLEHNCNVHDPDRAVYSQG
jgi:hypothetical protein